MNVDVQFTPDNIVIWNYEPVEIELRGIYIDIETNLITHINTLYLPPHNGYVEFSLNSDFFKYCKGFKVELYHNEELVKTSTHIYNDKLDSRLYFHRNDLANNYGSWMSLFHENEYGNKIRISPNDVVYDLGANIDLAITDHNKPINFYSFTENTGNTTSEIPMENIIQEKFKGIIEVQGINLEEYVIENMLPLPTILKVDIEGSEYDFIEHTSDAFFANVTQMIIEFHHNFDGTTKLEEINKIIKRFLNLGYNIQMKEGDSIDNDMFTILITKFG